MIFREIAGEGEPLAGAGGGNVIMNEPLTPASRTLSPLRGARGHGGWFPFAPRQRGEGGRRPDEGHFTRGVASFDAPERFRTIADGIAGARLEIIEGAGHAVIIEKPDAVNEALLRFLA